MESLGLKADGMDIRHTHIQGVDIVASKRITDHRGAFMRLFCDDELSAVLKGRVIRQINFSRTETRGALRGLHFQKKPAAEMKMVRCLRGRVFDVAVDLRAGSPTFLQWHAEELTPESTSMMIIPEGCAHGFQALEAGCELLYLHTASYDPVNEGGVLHDDPALEIKWPLPVTDISARDTAHPAIDDQFKGLEV